MKAEVGKLDFDKFANVPTGLNNVKTKLDTSDVVELKFLPVDLKKLNDLIKNEVIKNSSWTY